MNPGCKPTVLVADDAAEVALRVAELLAEAGAEVVATAADGAQALALFERTHPDAVVLDIEMPRLGGLDVLKAIRAQGQAGSQRPLVIMMTSHNEPAWREECLAAGADHFLLKQAEIEQLLQIVPAYTASCDTRVGKVTTNHEKLTTVGFG
jgi:CheY-like chemotaxis protein